MYRRIREKRKLTAKKELLNMYWYQTNYQLVFYRFSLFDVKTELKMPVNREN